MSSISKSYASHVAKAWYASIQRDEYHYQLGRIAELVKSIADELHRGNGTPRIKISIGDSQRVEVEVELSGARIRPGARIRRVNIDLPQYLLKLDSAFFAGTESAHYAGISIARGLALAGIAREYKTQKPDGNTLKHAARKIKLEPYVPALAEELSRTVRDMYGEAYVLKRHISGHFFLTGTIAAVLPEERFAWAAMAVLNGATYQNVLELLQSWRNLALRENRLWDELGFREVLEDVTAAKKDATTNQVAAWAIELHRLINELIEQQMSNSSCDNEDDSDDQDSDDSEDDSGSESNSNQQGQQSSGGGEDDGDSEQQAPGNEPPSPEEIKQQGMSGGNDLNEQSIDGQQYNEEIDYDDFKDIEFDLAAGTEDALNGDSYAHPYNFQQEHGSNIPREIPLPSQDTRREIEPAQVFDGFGRLVRLAHSKIKRKSPPMRRGQLQGNRLYRAMTDQLAFHVKHTDQKRNERTEFIIRLDVSGSMGWRLAPVAQMGSALFNELKSASVPVAIYADTTGAVGGILCPVVYPLASWGLDCNYQDERVWSALAQNAGNGATNGDGLVLEYLAGKFTKRPGKKVLLVGSDGIPTFGLGHDAERHLKRTVDVLRKRGIIIFAFSMDRGVVDRNNFFYGAKYNIPAYGSDIPAVFKKQIKEILNLEGE